ncbi:non-specific lipid transfer protein GPI-anchored 30-like [Macadamia integrifolia]|uniref:non-specific lipid transfer protein GPI-anchored 30-like n=1 Tax=Macadamia integrifolia TaxID=60698 RepID=UPI001C4E559B|nr:non-specific lipid transfer protein GPI-anchored 30-like [Macadamia integrifolia]
MEKKVGGIGGCDSGFFVMAAVLVVVAMLSLVCEGQAQDTSCLNQLVPCLNYLQRQDGSDPPKSCCDPLKSVIDSNPQCLCTMVTNSGTRAAEQAGVNVTNAQELPGKCGQTVNPIACLTSSGPGSAPNTGRAQSNSTSDFSLMAIVMASIVAMSFQILWASSSI